MGVDPVELPVSTVIFGAEPCTDPMRAEIEDRLDATGIDLYGLSEIIGPGVSNECHEAKEGLHVWGTTSTPRSSIPKPARSSPRARKANSS